ncbi:uncharacterized protein TNCV_4990291 [Trichonephila clavipes]|uniref:Uncharacterized protein n=1 Tax=Trichonephila clavipes TaxID=2585209 RepID=A0A8X7BHH6_TRICX|nr:uncharacterized protein TNCV_4990291 [Trichonephila clavipes]
MGSIHDGHMIKAITCSPLNSKLTLNSTCWVFLCCCRVLPEGKELMLPEPVRQVGLLYDRWRRHLSPPPQFKYGTGGEGTIPQPPALVVSATTAHKTFGPTDLTSTYSVCTRRVFGGIEPMPSGLESNALTTRLPKI